MEIQGRKEQNLFEKKYSRITGSLVSVQEGSNMYL